VARPVDAKLAFQVIAARIDKLVGDLSLTVLNLGDSD